MTELAHTASAATTLRAGNWKPYPAYKGSGVEWLREIPEHWEIWKVAHAFKCIGSGTTPPSSQEDYYDGDIPWVNTTELRDSAILDTQKKVTSKALADLPTLRIYSPDTPTRCATSC